jgi:hypothetical protein
MGVYLAGLEPRPARPALQLQTELEQPARSGRILIVLIALGLFSVAISLAGRFYGGQIRLGGNTTSSEQLEIVVSNSVLNVPANYIRTADQRQSGVKARLDLYALWPSMTGYAIGDRRAFENHDGEPARLLFISIEPRQMSRDMSGRLAPIYRQLIESTSEPSDVPGLEAFRFRADRGIFANEMLYVAERPGEEAFVARCIVSEDNSALAPCERDVFAENDISVKYRFPRALLKQFEGLDQAVLGLVAGFSADRK